MALGLTQHPSLRVNDARTTARSAATTAANNYNQFDYHHLTLGGVEMREGDVAIETHINIKHESKAELLAKTHYAIIEVDSYLSGPGQAVTADKISNVFKIKLGKKKPTSQRDIFSRESREAIRKLVENAAIVHARKLAETIICKPMKARLELVNEITRAYLGTRQGKVLTI